jgi:hypothetical protein
MKLTRRQENLLLALAIISLLALILFVALYYGP